MRDLSEERDLEEEEEMLHGFVGWVMFKYWE